MKKKNPAISARGFDWRGWLGAAPGSTPKAAWGSIPHISIRTITADTLTPRPPRVPAES